MLTLRGYLALAVVLGLFLLGGWAGCAWQQGRIDKAKREAATATDAATGSGLTVGGERATNAAVGKAQADIDQARNSADALNAQAHQDPSAAGALPDSVRDRVRAGDDELCKRAACR